MHYGLGNSGSTSRGQCMLHWGDLPFVFIYIHNVLVFIRNKDE